VIALFGDGAAMFSIAELATAVEQRLALPVVIADNGGYAEIREQMLDRGITPQAVDLRSPDFVALGEALGAHAFSAASPDDLGPLAAEALKADRPTLIHHRIERPG
jgi:thiamine pyrophosphate-dependent acetolactate synthase large subunit-like protein